MRTLNRSLTLLLFALGFAGFGAALAVRTVWQSRSGVDTNTVVDGDSQAEWERRLAAMPNFSRAVNPALPVEVTLETVERVAEDVRDRVGSLARSSPDVSALGTRAIDALVDAAHEQAAIYLSGSFERHWAFLERSGALPAPFTQAATDSDRSDAMRRLRSIFESTTEPYALKPISLDEIVVRTRYVEGRGGPLPDDSYVASIGTRPTAWPELSGEPSKNGYTVVEVMIPVLYVRDDVMTPVYFAIWFVHDARDGTWKINQTRVYNPLMAALQVYPVY